ncbi:2792_t:CDS:1, partial [Racocetra persica]
DLYKLMVNSNAAKEDNYKTKSFYIDSAELSEGVKYLMKFAESFKCESVVEIGLIGGKIDEIRRNETAFVHRGFMYLMAIRAQVPSEMCSQDLENFSRHFQRKYSNYESYQNFIDRQLDNWQ